METNKDIGNQLKKVLDSHNVSPSDSVWMQIEGDLKKEKRKRRLLIFWFSFGLASLVLASILLLNNNLESNNNNSNRIENGTKISDNNFKDNDGSAKNLNKQINNGEAVNSDENINQEKNSNNNQNIITTKKRFQKTKLNESTSNKRKLNITNNKSTTSTTQNENKRDYQDMSTNTKIKEKNNQKINKENISKTQDNWDVSAKPQVKLQVDEIENKDPEITSNIEDEVVKNNDKENEIEEGLLRKWSISPHISLDYYSSFNKSFTKNNSINYGVYFTFLATKKTTIRIGVNKLDLKYSQNIQNQLRTQELSYLEIPFEVKYKVIDKKIDASIITGISYLVLNDASLNVNEDIISNSSFFESSNLSVNLGIAIETKIHKRLNFNLEPIFKYQINPYDKQSDFSIFTLSILAGLEYQF